MNKQFNYELLIVCIFPINKLNERNTEISFNRLLTNQSLLSSIIWTCARLIADFLLKKKTKTSKANSTRRPDAINNRAKNSTPPFQLASTRTCPETINRRRNGNGVLRERKKKKSRDNFPSPITEPWGAATHATCRRMFCNERFTVGLFVLFANTDFVPFEFCYSYVRKLILLCTRCFV